VQTKQLIWKQDFNEEKTNTRLLAHAISDEIIYRITGEKGIAQSRIAFINNSTGSKELYVVDYDGFNLVRLTNERSIILFPRWSPDGKKICYTSYKDRNPDLFLINPDGTGKRTLSVRQGLNMAARWSRDGTMLALTLSPSGNPDIYLINPAGLIVRQITHEAGVETAADFSPTGQNLVYISDKAGYPQMYICDIFGQQTRRLMTPYHTDSPVWSLRGDTIAFAMFTASRKIDLYKIDIFGRRLTQLTVDSYSNENPSWSPDGRFIVFTSTRNGNNELFIMTADGTNQHRVLEIKGDCFTPCWGPSINPHVLP
jgi:TolB protein